MKKISFEHSCKSWKSYAWGKMIDEIPGVIIKFYPVDLSYNSPVVELIIGGKSFKIRLKV